MCSHVPVNVRIGVLFVSYVFDVCVSSVVFGMLMLLLLLLVFMFEVLVMFRMFSCSCYTTMYTIITKHIKFHLDYTHIHVKPCYHVQTPIHCMMLFCNVAICGYFATLHITRDSKTTKSTHQTMYTYVYNTHGRFYFVCVIVVMYWPALRRQLFICCFLALFILLYSTFKSCLRRF